MFWIFATAVGLALGFMKLGAISVWVLIMSLLIKAGLLLALVVALYQWLLLAVAIDRSAAI